jgi:hypothetical protein
MDPPPDLTFGKFGRDYIDVNPPRSEVVSRSLGEGEMPRDSFIYYLRCPNRLNEV